MDILSLYRKVLHDERYLEQKESLHNEYNLPSAILHTEKREVETKKKQLERLSFKDDGEYPPPTNWKVIFIYM